MVIIIPLGANKVGHPDLHNQPWMMKAGNLVEVVVFALNRPKDFLMERIIVSKI